MQPIVRAFSSKSEMATSPDTTSRVALPEPRFVSWSRTFLVVASIVFLGLLPLWALYDTFASYALQGGHLTDFKNTFYPAAEAVRYGVTPYPDPGDDVVALGRAFVYPPLAALVAVPLTLLSLGAAQVVVALLLVASIVLTLWVLGVRDWRCYGLVFLWPPFLAAVKTGNITALLTLGAALTWRYRDRAALAGATVGVSLAAKLFLWPVLLWMAATRRWRALVLSFAIALTLLFASWGAIGFAGLGDYATLLRRLQSIEAPQSYTLYALGLDLGAPSWLARGLWTVLALALLLACVHVARRGDERRAFMLALVATLACSPIVWLNYFVLLVVVVAVARPRLVAAWFVPLLMYGSASTENGTTAQNALTLGAAALTVVLALWTPEPGKEQLPAGATRPAAARP